MVNRQTLVANTQTEFNFDVKGETIYTIKNFTNGYIYVYCGVGSYDENKAVKIPSMTAQSIKAYSSKLIVNAIEGGEVEVDA